MELHQVDQLLLQLIGSSKILKTRGQNLLDQERSMLKAKLIEFNQEKNTVSPKLESQLDHILIRVLSGIQKELMFKLMGLIHKEMKQPQDNKTIYLNHPSLIHHISLLLTESLRGHLIKKCLMEDLYHHIRLEKALSKESSILLLHNHL